LPEAKGTPRASRPVVIWDTSQKVAVISDLHLGSAFCRWEAALAWLGSLPEDVLVALNGDILDDVRRSLPATHRQVLDRLVEASFEREMVWVVGNHDDDLPWESIGRITVVRHLEIGKSLLVIHGDYFDDVMPRSRLFISVFAALHALRLKLGAPHVHVAEYAKKWRPLYKVLNDNVKENAAASARRNGFQAVVCGHTHHPMDIVHKGVRYLNTGAWTEEPLHYLQMENGRIQMSVFSP